MNNYAPFVEALAIIAFIVLLLAAIFMLVNMYVCDSQNCKAFNVAASKAPKGSKEYVIDLMQELYNDGIWPFPYIGAAIGTPLALWFLGVPITIKNFAILFFVTFVVIYFMFSFFGHHYIRPITSYVIDYIEDDCVCTDNTPETPQ